jgi:hypothetical protein
MYWNEIVYTIPGTDNVRLELYADTTDGKNGGTLIKIHEMTNVPRSWKATKNVGCFLSIQLFYTEHLYMFS